MQVGLVVGGGMLELRVGERRVQMPGLGKLVTGSLYRYIKKSNQKSIQLNQISNDNSLVTGSLYRQIKYLNSQIKYLNIQIKYLYLEKQMIITWSGKACHWESVQGWRGSSWAAWIHRLSQV